MDRERISVIQLDNSGIEGAMKSLEAFCNRITGVSGNIITPELQTSNVG